MAPVLGPWPLAVESIGAPRTKSIPFLVYGAGAPPPSPVSASGSKEDSDPPKWVRWHSTLCCFQNKIVAYATSHLNSSAISPGLRNRHRRPGDAASQNVRKLCPLERCRRPSGRPVPFSIRTRTSEPAAGSGRDISGQPRSVRKTPASPRRSAGGWPQVADFWLPLPRAGG